MSEAELQARRALRGYKKLGVGGQTGLQETLDLLIVICEAKGNSDDAEAYSAYKRLLRSSSLDLHAGNWQLLDETGPSV
jgi:hypothetical protein